MRARFVRGVFPPLVWIKVHTLRLMESSKFVIKAQKYKITLVKHVIILFGIFYA